VQEPVAYIEHHKGGDNLVWDDPGGKRSPLYTTPPNVATPLAAPAPDERSSAWVGLTNKEIEFLCYADGALRQRTATEMAFAVESKLREKNTCPDANKPATPPAAQRQWVGLTGQQKNLIARISFDVFDAIHRTETKLKEKNNGLA
jgi:hypothetical protein